MKSFRFFVDNMPLFSVPAFGTEEELRYFLCENNISIVSESEFPIIDPVYGKEKVLRLSFECLKFDNKRKDEIKDKVKELLVSLECDESNIIHLISSFNFKEEFLNWECKNRKSIFDGVTVNISVNDCTEVPTQKLSLALDHFWYALSEKGIIKIIK